LFIKKYGIKTFVGLVCLVAFSACTTHTYKDKNYYKRANKASEKALDKLDRE